MNKIEILNKLLNYQGKHFDALNFINSFKQPLSTEELCDIFNELLEENYFTGLHCTKSYNVFHEPNKPLLLTRKGLEFLNIDIEEDENLLLEKIEKNLENFEVLEFNLEEKVILQRLCDEGIITGLTASLDQNGGLSSFIKTENKIKINKFYS